MPPVRFRITSLFACRMRSTTSRNSAGSRLAAPDAGIADMQMDDRGAGRVGIERRGGNLRGRHGHIAAFAHRIRRARHGAGDEDLGGNHGDVLGAA